MNALVAPQLSSYGGVVEKSLCTIFSVIMSQETSVLWLTRFPDHLPWALQMVTQYEHQPRDRKMLNDLKWTLNIERMETYLEERSKFREDRRMLNYLR